MKVLVAGTPGVGKTTFSRAAADELKIEHIDISEYIRSERLYDEYDPELDTNIFDVDRVREHLGRRTGAMDSFIIDTHSPAVAAGIGFDFIFHLKCSTAVLHQRLCDRGYSGAKVSENIECECLDMVGEELEENFDTEPVCVSGEAAQPAGTVSAQDALKMLREARRGAEGPPTGRRTCPHPQ